MRLINPIILLAGAAFALSGCGKKEETAKSLSLFIWEEYIDPEVLKEFEAETGIAVSESNYTSNEEMLAKLPLSKGAYDVVVPSDYMIQVMGRQGMLARLDKSKLSGLANLSPRFAKPPYDEGLFFSAPYHWGTSGIAYNKEKVAAPPKSWAAFFNPTTLAAQWGKVSLLDDSRETIGAALIATGSSPNSTVSAELAAARNLIKSAKQYVGKFDSESFEDSLASGETTLVHGWSGEVAVAQSKNPNIGYIVPSDGVVLFVDNLAILSSSKKQDAAHKLIDFLLRPEIAARVSNFTRYGTCNAKALPMVDAAVLKGASYLEPPEGKFHMLADVGGDVALYEKAWSQVKAE